MSQSAKKASNTPELAAQPRVALYYGRESPAREQGGMHKLRLEDREDGQRHMDETKRRKDGKATTILDAGKSLISHLVIPNPALRQSSERRG